MKMVVGIVRPFKLDEVREAVLSFGRVATLSEIRAYTPRRDAHGALATTGNPREFFPKIRIEILVPDEEVEQAMEVLRKAAWTGRFGEGDGIILVTDVLQALRIRTADVGGKAL